MYNKILYSTTLVIAVYFKMTICLRVSRVVIPTYRLRGEPAHLECDFELGTDRLYSVKWYRDNEEFYRYMPKLEPPQHSYKVDGVKVDLLRSDARRVSLKPLNLKSSGQYRCEVSAEAPSFASAQAEGHMEVLYLPKDGPRITGNEREYRVGDPLDLNCSSGRAYPAPMLDWYINDEKVTEPSHLIKYPVTRHAHGLLSSLLGLAAPARRAMRLRCVASVAPPADALSWDHKEAMLLVKSSAGSSAPLGKALLISLVCITIWTSQRIFSILQDQVT